MTSLLFPSSVSEHTTPVFNYVGPLLCHHLNSTICFQNIQLNSENINANSNANLNNNS